MATVTGTLLKGAYGTLKNPAGRAVFGGIAGTFYGASQYNRPESWASYGLAGAAIGGFGGRALSMLGSMGTARGLYQVGKFAGKTGGKALFGNPLRAFGGAGGKIRAAEGARATAAAIGSEAVRGIGRSGMVGGALASTAKLVMRHPSAMLIGGAGYMLGSSFMRGAEGGSPEISRAASMGHAYNNASGDIVLGLHQGRHG